MSCCIKIAGHKYSCKKGEFAMVPNQNPEQIARDNIDDMLKASGWSVQDNKKIDFTLGQGQAVREYQTDIDPADYVLFVDKKPVGVIEAKYKISLE